MSDLFVKDCEKLHNSVITGLIAIKIKTPDILHALRAAASGVDRKTWSICHVVIDMDDLLSLTKLPHGNSAGIQL